MTRFVWLDVPGGGAVPVNPDQVAYVKQALNGATTLIFGAVQGGLHEVAVTGEAKAVVAALEGPKFEARSLLEGWLEAAVKPQPERGALFISADGATGKSAATPPPKSRRRRTPQRPAS